MQGYYVLLLISYVICGFVQFRKSRDFNLIRTQSSWTKVSQIILAIFYSVKINFVVIYKTIQNIFSITYVIWEKNISIKLVLAWHDIIEFEAFHCSSWCFWSCSSGSDFIAIRNEAKFKWCSHSYKKNKRSVLLICNLHHVLKKKHLSHKG